MKSFIIILTLFLSYYAQAQIKGNKNIVSQRFDATGLEELSINLNIDMEVFTEGEESYIEITTDENIIPYINLETLNGKLELDQKEWIESSGTFKLKVVAPDLEKIYNDSWVDMSISLSGQEIFEIYSSISKIRLTGNVDIIKATTENSDIDLTQLNYNELISKKKGDGHIIIPDDKMDKTMDVTTIKKLEARKLAPKFKDARFFNFKIRNNSKNSFPAYVKGPKPDGTYFSYGFNFYSFQVKKEYWSVGTELYKVSKSGNIKIYTVKAEDEGQTVDIWN